MAEYVTKIRTENGDKQIDYNALANLPQPDATLTKSGSFADAKATGSKIEQVVKQVSEAGYVTETVLNEKGYVTEQKLSQQGYVTETKLAEKNYATQTDLTKVEQSVTTLQSNSYSPSNQPPYPVTSVNGATGAVNIKVGVQGASNNHITVFNANGDLKNSGINLNNLAQVSMTTSGGENILIVTPISI